MQVSVDNVCVRKKFASGEREGMDSVYCILQVSLDGECEDMAILMKWKSGGYCILQVSLDNVCIMTKW